MLCLFLLISGINAYFYKTHYYLGELISDDLKSKLKIDSFGEISTWADKVKRTPKYSWSRTLHYIDITNCESEISVNDYCENFNCIYFGILNMTNDLKYNRKYDTFNDNDNDNDNIKFLIHFLQDFNQPMHLLGFYRGGNDYPINLKYKNKIKKTNIHTLWDSILPEYYIENFNYTCTYIDQKYFSNINEYSLYLTLKLKENLQIGCKYTRDFYTKKFYTRDFYTKKFYTRDFYTKFSQENFVEFDDYFDKDVIRKLFDNYIELIINTFEFILN